MIRQSQKFIDHNDNPLIAGIGIRFLEAFTENVSIVARAHNKTYRSLGAATKEGMAFKKLHPVINKAVWDTLYSVAGMRVKGFREQSLKSAIIAYLNTPSELSSEYQKAA